MKKLLKLTCAVCLMVLALASCTADLQKTLDEHGNRIQALETLCSQINGNVTSLQTLVSALEQNDYVKSVSTITEGGKTVGYTINFSKAQAVSIYNGKDGATPAIGIKNETDGNSYWTLNGELLKDNSGNKVKANGNDAIAPQLKIVDGKWKISTDGGSTWSDAGQATGDSFFKEVNETATDVTFTLADGKTTFAFKKYIPFKIGTDNGNDALLLEHSKAANIDIRMPEGLLESDYAGMMATVKEGSIVTKAGNAWNTQISKPVFEGGKYKSGAAVVVTPPFASPTVVTLEVTLLLADGSTMQTSRIIKSDGHEYVDLGLSVKWATCNVGAYCEADCGQYFAWGETEEKTNYSNDNYRWGTYDCESWPDFGFTKYISEYTTPDGPFVLEAEDDAATVLWGKKWHTPTLEQIEELFDENKCEWKEETKYDSEGKEIAGFSIISKVSGYEGNSIFLPKAGHRQNSNLPQVGEYAYYWSSTNCSEAPGYSYYIYFSPYGAMYDFDGWRTEGYTVRPVTE